MTRKDERGKSLGVSSFRSRLSVAILTAVVLLTAVGVRLIRPTTVADAQAPRQRVATARALRNTTSQKSAARVAGRPASETKRTKTGNSTAGQNVVAVVNGEPITRTSLGKQCLVRWGGEVLESLVNKHLITQACLDRGIAISNKDIEDEIMRIAGKFNLTTEHWLKMLKTERNVSPQQYRRDIIWPTLALRTLASEKLRVTQEELDREFESQYGPKVQVRMISVTSQAKAEKVLQLAKAKPDDFPTLAKEHSDDPNTASARGLIPPVRMHLGEPEIEKAVFSLRLGEVSPIVKAANQFLIFRCEKHIPAATISPQYQQLTRERLKDQIVERNLRDAAGDLFKELQASAKVVNVLNDPTLRQQSPGVAAFVNSTPITMQQLTAECLARYGRDMLDTEINFRLLSQSLKQRSLTVSQAAINQEVARAAQAFGYLNKDGSADVDTWVKKVTEEEGIGVREYIRDAVWPSVALKLLVGNRVEVTSEDLEKGFQANYGQRVEVLAIVLGNQRLALQVWDMANRDPSREFFGQLAEQYSIESVSRANFGEIPPIRRHSGQPQIENEAFKLKPGELSGIVAMGDKFVIMKCLGYTEPYVEKLEDVKTELTKDIHEKKLRLAMAEEFDDLRQSAQIDNFLTNTSQTGTAPVKPVSTSPRARDNPGSARAGRQTLVESPRRR